MAGASSNSNVIEPEVSTPSRRKLHRIAVAVLVGLSWSLRAATVADASFERLAQAFIEDYLRLNPEAATQLGDHRFDGFLSDYSPAALQHQHVDYLNARRVQTLMHVHGSGQLQVEPTAEDPALVDLDALAGDTEQPSPQADVA